MTEPPATRLLSAWCNRLAHAALPGDYCLLDNAGLTSGHPWAFLAELALADPGSVAYYRYLHGLARLADPVNILEIGTAFGLSAASFIQGAPRLRRLISLDLGVFTRQYEVVEQAEEGWPAIERYKQEELVADGRNIAFARQALDRLVQKMGSPVQVSLYQVNTQPASSDNFDIRVSVPRWFDVPELVAELEANPIDLLFIDGKHTEDGLYQDFKSFFPYVRAGGIVICDDLHDASFPYAWAGQTLASYERVREEFAVEIEDAHIWAFPQLPDWYKQEPNVRPFGLIRKRGPADSGTEPPGQAPALLGYEIKDLTLPGPEAVDEVRRERRYTELGTEIESLGMSDRDAKAAIRFLHENRQLVQEIEVLVSRDAAGATLQHLRFLHDHADLFTVLGSQGLTESSAAHLRFLQEHADLFNELDLEGLTAAAASHLRFLREHADVFAELDANGLAESAAEHLRFLREQADLFAQLDTMGLTESAAAHLRFLQEHADLFAELDAQGLAESAAERLRFLGERAELFTQLDSVGLTESAPRLLRFLKEHAELVAQLDSLGLTSVAPERLRFLKDHPALAAFLAIRPRLSLLLERQCAKATTMGASAASLALALRVLLARLGQ